MMFKVCTIDDVPLGEGRSVRIGERQIALFRSDGGWYALDNRCPHRDGPLADGIVAERSVICPLHDRRFDLASGRELTGELCVAAHQVLVHGTDVFIVIKETRMEQSIYEQIGGAPAVEAALDGFYEKVWNDPDLIAYFTTTDRDALKGHQRAFITAALGGPNDYSGQSMAAAHDGRGITDEAFDRVVEHLADTLAELGVPAATIGVVAGALAPLRPDIVERPALAETG